MNFKDFIVEQKNTHMEHAEDDVLNGGVNGARDSINALRNVRDMLTGHSKSKVDISVKWDGAPAVFAGQDPTDGKFFVAKKGVFNKNPKVYKTPAEIDADTSGDLADKLKACLMWLPKIGIKGVIQGDLLFTQSDLKTETIEDESYVTFHPNTLVYAVPSESELAKDIKRAKIGIVWHTIYEGDTFETMSAVFGKDILSTLTKNPNVWMTSAVYHDVSGKATLTKDEYDKVTSVLSEAGKVFQKLDASTLNYINTDADLIERIKTFNNSKVRAQLKITNVKAHVKELIEYIEEYYEKQAAGKGEKGRATQMTKKQKVLNFFSDKNKSNLENIFTLINLLAEAKLILIKKMDEVKQLHTFLLTKNGYEVTGVEGYVAIDKIKGNAVKLVDRMQFSHANFSPDIIKGWQRGSAMKESFIREAKTKSKVVVVYGGGFQPFHAGHLSSYTQAKNEFHTPDFYVASSNDTKVRPIPFKDKEFLAQQAGVTDHFVQVIQPINPKEIMDRYDETNDILILVRSERDPMKYTKKDGSPAYYQPFVSINKCESFDKHAYIFVTKKHDFKVNGELAFSGSQIRKMYAEADSDGRDEIINDLYPKSKNKSKVKKLLDKYIGGGMSEELEEAKIKLTAAQKIQRAIEREREKNKPYAAAQDRERRLTAMINSHDQKKKEDEKNESILGYSQRLARGQRFKRMQKRLLRTRLAQAKRFADPKRLKGRAVKDAYKLFRARITGGKNYASLSTGEKISVDTRLQKMLPGIKKLAARLVGAERQKEMQRKQKAMMKRESTMDELFSLTFNLNEVAQDSDIKNKEGTQPKKYYAGLDKNTKELRSAHFEKNGPKSDSDKSGYEDAPGDKEAREKGMPQSKHTLKFKKMYGESMDRKESSRLDQLVRMGLADTKMLSVLKRSMEKLKSGDQLSTQEKSATNDLLSTLLDMVLSSDSLFGMTRKQLQKESVDDKFKKYITPASKSTPKIEKISTPAGKSGNGTEWKVTGKLSSETRTFKSKKDAEDYFNIVKESMDDYEDNYEDSPEMDGIEMAQIELANMIEDANDLLDMLDEMDEEPDQWVLSKITKAADYIATASDYLQFEDNFEMGDEEDDDGEYSGEIDDSVLDQYTMDAPASDYGSAYEEFRPIIEEIEGLQKKAEKSGISYSILKQVYNRGMAAWQGGHRPGTTPQQWAFARVNSFITKGQGTWGGADSDLASKVKKNEEFSKFAEALEWGTDALRMSYARATPGQSPDIITAKYSANSVMNTLNDITTQRKKKIFDEETSCCGDCKDEIVETVDWENILVEADYQGKTVKLNDPFRTPGENKKFGVYTMGPNGDVVIVRFGDPNMEIKRDDPERRASYRARHGCDNPGPKWKANYWSCYQWRAGAKVDS
jgi:hypothetical protein